jgi:hypothetical protein
VVEVCRIGGMKENHLKGWFESKSASTRRQRLHGWRLWQAHCVENVIEVEGMRKFANPGMEVANFIMAMSQMGTPHYLVREALTAVKELFELVAPRALTVLRESFLERQAVLAAVTGVIRGAMYKDIWDLRVVLEYIRKGPPSEGLPRKELRGRTAFLMMVLLPCRPVGMRRMDVSGEKWAEDGNSVEGPTREKMNLEK